MKQKHINPDTPVTVGILQRALQEMVDTILKGMDNLQNQNENRFESIDKRFDKVDKKLDKIESNVYFIKQDVKDIKADLSDTPTRSEFNQLKTTIKILQKN